MPNVDLPRISRTRVWVRTRDIISNDSILAKAIQTFVVWDGSWAARCQTVFLVGCAVSVGCAMSRGLRDVSWAARCLVG